MKKGLVHSRSVIALYWVLIPAVSMAYFDPGSGAFMVQTIFTLIGAAIFYIRHPMRLARSIGESFKRFLRTRDTVLAPADSEELNKLDGAGVAEEIK